jgi:hypothetical protein
MPKANVFQLTGDILEIGEPKFLQNGAEVQTLLIGWKDGEYAQSAAIDFYDKRGLDKLHALNLKGGENVTIPCTPSSKVREGEGAKGAYRFFQTTLRGDSWRVVVNSGAEAPIEF